MPFGGLLTVGLISAGTKLAGGAIASKGAKKASQQQQDAAKRAEQFARERYQESANIVAPYREAGEGALRTLSGLLGQYRQPSMPPSAMPWMRSNPTMPPAGVRTMGANGGYTMANMLGGQAPQGGGGTVMMQSPDGEQRAVPASMVRAYLNRGAKIAQQRPAPMQQQPVMSEVLMP